MMVANYSCSNFLSSAENIHALWHSEYFHAGICLERTILVWIPCAIVFVLSLIDIIFSKRDSVFSLSSTQTKRGSCIQALRSLRFWRLVIIGALFVNSCLRLIGVPIEESRVTGATDGFFILSVAFMTESLAILALITRRDFMLSRRDGPVGFLSSVLFVMFGLPEAASKFGGNYSYLHPFDRVTYLIQYALFCISAILFCISPDQKEVKRSLDPKWPERCVSFPNRLFFFYYWRILIKGWKTLHHTDLWTLDEPEQSAVIYERFAPWLTRMNEKHEKSPGLALFLALLRTYRGLLTVTMILIVLKELLSFIVLLVIKRIIEFAMYRHEPPWHGWIYIAILCLFLLARGVCTQHRDFRIIKFSIRVRSALSACIARKTLRLSADSRREYSEGEIINFAVLDVGRFFDNVFVWHMPFAVPLQFLFAAYMISSVAGKAGWAGLGVCFVSVCIMLFSCTLLVAPMIRMLAYRDKRMQLTTETLNYIKVIKFYAWELAFKRLIERMRLNELKNLRMISILAAPLEFLFIASTPLACITIYAIYTEVYDLVLTAQMVFVVAATFRFQFSDNLQMNEIVLLATRLRISMKQIGEFLVADELVDYIERKGNYKADGSQGIRVKVFDGHFVWTSPHTFDLDYIAVNAFSPRLIAITGVIGSGKTSLISALMGEMRLVSGSVEISGSIAYVSQHAWLLNDSVKGNILFGREYVKERYNRVLEACALLPDLAILPAGDETEVGDRGLNLSGGQKQRIALARAVYQDRDIYLLDDPLSAVDVHVQQHLFDKVIGPKGLLRRKLRMLVTNASTYLPLCDEVIVMENGRIQSPNPNSGTEPHYRPLILSSDGESKKPTGESPVRRRRSTIHGGKSPPDAAEAKPDDGHDGRLTEEEEVGAGKVSWSAYWLYFKAGGVALFAALIMGMIGYALDAGAVVWLGHWTDSALEKHKNGTSGKVTNQEGLTGLGIIAGVQSVVAIGMAVPIVLFPFRVAKIIHEKFLTSILRAPLSFFDSTPVGRLLNRFGKDTFVIDVYLYVWILFIMHCGSSSFFGILPAIVASPFLLLIVIPGIICLFALQRFFMSSARQFQRLEAVSRSPIFSHMGNMVGGSTNIRAYGRQMDFITQYYQILDHNARAQMMLSSSQQWLGTNLAIMCTILTCAAVLPMMITDISPGMIGMSLATLIGITDVLMLTARRVCELESLMVSTERIDEYLRIKSEAEWTRNSDDRRRKSSLFFGRFGDRKQSKPLYGTFSARNVLMRRRQGEDKEEMTTLLSTNDPGNGHFGRAKDTWLTSGCIEFNDYSLKYRPDLPAAIKNLNLIIKAGEKVGVVGRTGAGKTSLTLGLFRLIEPASGSIVIDSTDISQLGLHELRSQLTIIPQDPAVFSGSIRQNIDPLDEHTDEEIWRALENSRLKRLVQEAPDRLDTVLDDGGGNLSVGQRQLICLTRALLRRSKILVLDEATACVDPETDKFIQNTIRTQFAPCTVLTIAHRIETVMDYDKIAVFKDGQLVEYGPVNELLGKDSGEFQRLVRKAGLAPGGGENGEW